MTREEALTIVRELLPGLLDATTSNTYELVTTALLAAYERGQRDEWEACWRTVDECCAPAIRARGRP